MSSAREILSYLHHHGARADFGLPEITLSESGLCFVVASGHTVWDDLSRYRPGEQDAVMAVNDIGMHLPFWVKHWYSNDIAMLRNWQNARRPSLKNIYDRRSIITHSFAEGAKYHWPWPGHGTSSLNAVYTALALGFDKVVLAGAPLDDGGHYFDPPPDFPCLQHQTSNFVNEVPYADPNHPNAELKWWSEAKRHVFHGRVFSLSGRTRDLLGEP